MPKFSKDCLSKFIRTECDRQLKLKLYPFSESSFDRHNRDLLFWSLIFHSRTSVTQTIVWISILCRSKISQHLRDRIAQQMPNPQDPRPGLSALAQEGREWEATVIDYITRTFNRATGKSLIVGNSYAHQSGQIRYKPSELINLLNNNLQPSSFLIEVQYDVSLSFKSSLSIDGYDNQFNLEYSRVRPDIIEVLPSATYLSSVTPNGEVQPLLQQDSRLQLRIIDIKLTAEPSPSYFAEVTYYTMVLAGWLVDNNLDDRFVVVPDAGIWSGSYEGSSLVTFYNEQSHNGIVPTYQELRQAMEEDVERVPFDVFVPRIRRFLQKTMYDVLIEANWQNLDWHVDNRCKGCENLGYPWGKVSPLHCMPTAENQEHLSRVAFVSRGARSALEDKGVNTVSSLAQLPTTHTSFDTHQTLRTTRTVIGGRANALQNNQSTIPNNSGTTAVMPKWADLHIYLTVDFDIGSAITFAFGLQAFWLEPRPYGSSNPNSRQQEDWNTPQVFIVDNKNVQAEQRELINFLERINTILSDVRNRNSDTTVQFYIWDSVQYEQLTRIFSRHLVKILSNNNIRDLAWLFPPEEILPNHQLVTRRSPITIVKEVVKSVLATPVPHYYSLLQVARTYNWRNHAINLSVHPLFEDILSDLIPSERAHDIWSRSSQPYWQDQMNILRETVQKRLTAIKIVVDQLERDLGTQLDRTAPKINIQPPKRQNKLSWDSQLWYMFAKLDAVIAELEVHQIRAMPPYEREARFHSARLTRRLVGQEELQVLQQLGLTKKNNRYVYEIKPSSMHVKVRDGDFNFALAPEQDRGFLDRTLGIGLRGTPFHINLNDGEKYRQTLESITSVTVVKLDRDNCWIVVDQNNRWANRISFEQLENEGIADFSCNVILDPTYHDYFTKKLLSALQAIANPQIAQDRSLVREATGQTTGRGARQRSSSLPPDDILWNASNMSNQTVVRNLSSVKTILEQNGLNLNPTQWNAWERALSHRLQLIWGPPGTGKSRTARAIVVGAAIEASPRQQDRQIRILVSASTYTAIDNILLDIYDDICRILPPNTFEIYRLRSYLQPAPIEPRAIQIDAPLNRSNLSSQIKAIRKKLGENKGITIVGATSEQVHNLLTAENSSAQAEFFDLILIDEASQMDVAHAILVFCSLAENGSIVLAGDHLQLAPIHQAKPPKDLENMVGSIYTFCRDFQNVPDVMLDENYRSNETIVNFALNAGYRNNLSSYSSNIKLDLVTPIPTQKPSNWSSDLYWTPEWQKFLNPDFPTTCFVYEDGCSSQWNQFEADAVVSLISLLQNRMNEQLANEIDPLNGQIIPSNRQAYTPKEFWRKAVGVVTPHRAQQGLIVSKLQKLFVNKNVSPNDIRDAVDTVERFQGQQRDVIIASFAMGDPDAIAEEDEFLMSLNRFNVMASRARAKLIVLISQEVIDHLSSDIDTLNKSRLLKLYVDSFCRNYKNMNLEYFDNNSFKQVNGLFKWR